MKYRVIQSQVDESLDIITEDGGVASLHHNGDHYITTYYQRNLNDCDLNNYIWDELSEDKTYMTDWDGDPTTSEVITDALNWLAPHVPADEWVSDNSIWAHVFPER